ncbi:TPA: hypothetical protein RPW15_001473 [Campylobacter fetus subsp. venerealis]|nr:hypothetical protein [Campylobacter fetus subsp. venerealis]HDX6253954.1 hypothetical protein [Campylobacter fetus subsp. venerealis]HDX6258142.1 hypothetical protein [Campylobacter fetus subsp. venerealis]HDX6261801.1 hypothetical protein [Campylobacter fetus subsp. venerealis]HDX6263931.1 hypothetical protein [Campylobacter fetus subsp. venerealis]
MKKIVLMSLIAISGLFANDIDFKKGFETAVEAVRLELINGSNLNRALNYNEDRLLYLNTSKLSTNEILLAQFIAFSNGFTDLGYSNEKLYFGSYAREADRELSKKKLERLLGMEIEKEKNDKKLKYVTPVLDRGFYIQKRNIVEGAIKRSEYSTSETKNSEPLFTIYEPEKQVTQKKFEFFIAKNARTDVYTIDNSKIEKGVISDKKAIKKVGITDMSKLRYDKTVTTLDGVEYVKPHFHNYYFKKSDIKFLER